MAGDERSRSSEASPACSRRNGRATGRRSACSARTRSPASSATSPREVLRWLVYHVAELDLYVGVLPFAALIVLLVLWRRLPRSVRPFLAATASISFFLLLEVSAFSSLPSVQRIEERNLFYLAPLTLIALLVWVDQGAPRPPLGAGAPAVLAAALPALIPYERFIGVSAQSDTLLMLAVSWRLHERWVALDDLVAVATGAAAAAALAFLLVPRRHALLLPLAVLAFFLAVARPISARMEYAAAGALAEGMHKQDREWVDRAVNGSRARSACSGPATARASPSGRTSSSTAASARSSTRTLRWRAAWRRRR